MRRLRVHMIVGAMRRLAVEWAANAEARLDWPSDERRAVAAKHRHKLLTMLGCRLKMFLCNAISSLLSARWLRRLTLKGASTR